MWEPKTVDILNDVMATLNDESNNMYISCISEKFFIKHFRDTSQSSWESMDINRIPEEEEDFAAGKIFSMTEDERENLERP